MPNNFNLTKIFHYRTFVRLMSERGAKVFAFGLILTALLGTIIFFFFAFRLAQIEYDSEVKLEVVNEELLIEVLDQFPLFRESGASPVSPF